MWSGAPGASVTRWLLSWGWLPLRRGSRHVSLTPSGRGPYAAAIADLGVTMKMTASQAIGRKLVGAGTACVLAGGAGALMAAGTAQAAVKVMPACPAPVISGATATVTCSYTGAAQYWTVPAGVLQATFTLYGAAGAAGAGAAGYVGGVAGGGTGAEVTGTLRVTPGTVLQVN